MKKSRRKSQGGRGGMTHPVHSVSAFRPDAGLGDPGEGGQLLRNHASQEGRVSGLNG